MRTGFIGSVMCLTVACAPRMDSANDAARIGDATDVLGDRTDVAADEVSVVDGGNDAMPDVAPVDVAVDAPTDAPAVQDFPLVDPPAGFDAYPSSPALAITNETGRTVSRLSVSNASGDCIVVSGGSDIVLEHLAVGPCAGSAISLTGGVQRVTIRDVYVHDATGNGVSGFEAHGITITDSHFARVSTGAYLDRCDTIDFERNTVLDVLGPFPRGQMIQFNNVRSANNVVRCNLVENRPGESNPEDAINMFESAGTAASPILIEGNRVLGGGPSMSGGGILLGDGAGQYMIADDNTVVDPGQYGMSVAGGDHHVIRGNRIYARQQPFTNVGLFAWDQYNSSCNSIELSDNQVRWTNRDGVDNPYWDGGNCGTIDQHGNDFAGTLEADVIHVVPASCR